MEDKELSPQESLDLIQQMIRRARKSYTNGSFYFLLWGWITFIASLGHYYLATYTTYDRPYIVWLLTFVGAIISVVKGIKQGKKGGVRNYTGKMYSWIWLSLGLAMFTIAFNGEMISWNIPPFILLLAGVGTAVSGAMMNFRPLQIAALIFWILTFTAFRLSQIDQMLVLALGTGLGYLVPGYLMRNNFKKHGL